jgi:uncharacterized membrane protein YfcA
MIAMAIRVAAAAGLGGMAGLLGGLFGVGGGFLVIPLLGFFYGMDQQTAQGTVLIMVVPNVVWAFSRYRRRFGVDLRMAATIAGSALIATYPTARLATGLDPHVLRLAFALFLATIAATVAYHTWRGGSRVGAGPTRAWGWITIVGVIGGCFSGFFGVGGAFVAPPLLTTFFGLRQLEAQGLALALVSPSALIALLAYAEAGQGYRGAARTAGVIEAEDQIALRRGELCRPITGKTPEPISVPLTKVREVTDEVPGVD